MLPLPPAAHCLSPSLPDRALLYYRLLTTDVNICRKLFLAGGAASRYPATSEGEGALCSVSDGEFAESKEDDLRRKLFDEFNSLAVIYKMPSNMFVKDKYQLVCKAICLTVCLLVSRLT